VIIDKRLCKFGSKKESAGAGAGAVTVAGVVAGALAGAVLAIREVVELS